MIHVYVHGYVCVYVYVNVNVGKGKGNCVHLIQLAYHPGRGIYGRAGYGVCICDIYYLLGHCWGGGLGEPMNSASVNASKKYCFLKCSVFCICDICNMLGHCWEGGWES